MKVLVTGASGFLGSHIAERQAAGGHEVRLLLRPTSSREFLQFDHEVAIGDVTDIQSLGAAARDVDVVVHAAGLIKARSASEFAAVNDEGTANIVRASVEAQPGVTRFIYISSLAARGPGDGTGRSAPVTEYGRTKLAGEERVLESNLADRSTIFRMPVIYGPRDPALLPVFLGAKYRVTPLLSGGRNKISLIYATDAAAAVQSVIDSTGAGPVTYTPEDGSVHTWRDLVGSVEDAIGHKTVKVPVPKVAFTAAAHVSAAIAKIRHRADVFTPEKVDEMAQDEWVCSGEALRADTGWRPAVQIGEGASLTYRWYRSHRWL